MRLTCLRIVALILACLMAAPAFAGQRRGRAFPPGPREGFPPGPREGVGRPAPGDDPRRGPESTERFTRTVRLARNGTFDLSNVAGDIVITGGGGNEVRIDAVKRVRSRDEADAAARLQAIEIDIIEVTNRVEVRTVYPRLQRNLAGAVDYTVMVPQDAAVMVKTVSGDVRVSNVRGELRAESVSGSVTAADVPRVSGLRSVSGDITLTGGAAEASLTAVTVSGNLLVRGFKGRNLDASSVSGELRFDNVESERVTMKSVSGNIAYGGALAGNGRYEFNSHSGNIRLALVGDTGFDLDANTFSGDVQSAYALTLRGGDAPPGGRLGRGRGARARTVRGTFGDGSASLALQSFSGAIEIARR